MSDSNAEASGDAGRPSPDSHPGSSPGSSPGPTPGPSPGVKLAIEAGPLAAFFLGNSKWAASTYARMTDGPVPEGGNIYLATAIFMVAILVSLVASWVTEKRLPVMPLVTAVFVLVFGGLTLWLRDSTFIKMKPTVVNTLFGSILLGGLMAGRYFLKIVLGSALELPDVAWRTLTIRFALFFFFLAILNEVVWRSFSEDAWVKFKVFGIMPLTILFMMTQAPFLNRYVVEGADEGSDRPSDAAGA